MGKAGRTTSLKYFYEANINRLYPVYFLTSPSREVVFNTAAVFFVSMVAKDILCDLVI